MPVFCFIVRNPDPSTINLTLRQWLVGERRLGIRHVGVRAVPPPPPAAARAARVRAVPATPSRERARTTPEATTGTFLSDDPGLPALCQEELSLKAAGEQLAQLDAQFVRDCQRCGLHEQRTQTVFGAGRARPDVAFVGEGPGADEDREGVPFIGRAGQLLTRMIAAMTLTREQVYICNIVKCRPPGNRTPTENEMTTCSPYLWRQLGSCARR